MKRIRVGFLIVGAGLAGSVTGFLLKEAGADVLALELLDAKTKDKLCGGMMALGFNIRKLHNRIQEERINQRFLRKADKEQAC